MIFVTGASGFMGRALIAELLRRGHSVRGLVRPGSEARLPAGCEAAAGNPLDAGSFQNSIAPADTLVHLVGTPKPAPWKGKQFRAVDLVSAKASIDAARFGGVGHFIYVSVAMPAPVMQSYIRVRAEGEAALRASGLAGTILRPWYVLGPGRQWPLMLVPIYRALEAIPATRERALRLGLLRLEEMRGALVWAVEHPAKGIRVLETKKIREAATEVDNM